MGAGIGGLAAACLLCRAGHSVTVLEAAEQTGGKSRRVQLAGQRMDTGPSLFTFPGVWRELLHRCGAEGMGPPLNRLPGVGTYHYRGEECPLPVPEGHPWHDAWRRFEEIHGGLGPRVEELLTTDPLDRRALPALGRLLSIYGRRLTTRSYLESLEWMPEGLKEIIAIHTLNAGVAPYRTPALYASMPAIMARQGIFAPEGGVYEIPATLERLALQLGSGIHTGEPVEEIQPGRVRTGAGEYPADAVVGDVDEFRLQTLLGEKPRTPRRLSCSGVAVYAALEEPLPLPGHSVILPSDPQRLYESVEARAEPPDTMSFVNYYPPGEVYPNDRPVLALLLTAPANGRGYGLDDHFVEREMERASETLGLSRPITAEFEEHTVLDPAYFARGGAPGGALYGAAHPFWRSGPLHRPRYSDVRRPWLWRVGASVHPGGGIPAVLGGAMISTDRLLKRLR